MVSALLSRNIGTRFKSVGQSDETEKTVRFESKFANVSTSSNNINISVTRNKSSLKSIIRVSSGSTSALHQVMVHDETDTHTTQYPFLSIMVVLQE